MVKRKANLIPYLVKENEIRFYLSHRSKTADQYPNYWSFWGGKIESGETPEQAMLRELKEELNYTPKSYSYLGQFYDSMPNEKHIYYEKVSEEFEKQVKIQESQGGGFFTLSQIESELMIIEEDKNIIRKLNDIIQE